MTSTGFARRIMSSAIFSAAAILVAMVILLVLALVLQASIAVWGLLSVTITETTDASSIGLGFNVAETLVLWLVLTTLGSIRWVGARRGSGARATRTSAR